MTLAEQMKLTIDSAFINLNEPNGAVCRQRCIDLLDAFSTSLSDRGESKPSSQYEIVDSDPNETIHISMTRHEWALINNLAQFGFRVIDEYQRDHR